VNWTKLQAGSLPEEHEMTDANHRHRPMPYVLACVFALTLSACGGESGLGGSNEDPSAEDDSASTSKDASVTVDVLANDSDADGSLEASTVTVTSAAANGSTSVDTSEGEITYTPESGFSGTDTFDYTVDDDAGATSNAATVSISVGGGSSGSGGSSIEPTKLLWTEFETNGSETDGSEGRLMAYDPTADSPTKQTVSTNLPTGGGSRASAVFFATWEDGTTLPGAHYPATVFNTANGQLKRVSARPSYDLSPQTVSAESGAQDLKSLETETDYTNPGDSLIYYKKSGSPDDLHYVRLGAGSTQAPTTVNNADFEFADYNANGALQGFAWFDTANDALERRNFSDGTDTTLASSVADIDDAGFVDDKRILLVNGDVASQGSFKSYQVGDGSLTDVNESSSVSNLNISDKTFVTTANNSFDKLYAFAKVPNDTVRLLEIDLDKSPQVTQLADTGDTEGVLAGLGDNRIAWFGIDGDGHDVRSFSLSDGSSVTLASGDSAQALSGERARGGFVVVDQSSSDARAIDIGGSGEVVLSANANGPSALGGGIWDSRGEPVTRSRIVFGDVGGEIVSVDRANPGDSTQRKELGSVDASKYDDARIASYQPDALIRLDREGSGDPDIGYVDPNEGGSLKILTQNADVSAWPVYGY